MKGGLPTIAQGFESFCRVVAHAGLGEDDGDEVAVHFEGDCDDGLGTCHASETLLCAT